MSSTRCLLLGLAAMLPLAHTARAQRPISLDSVFVYSVKVVCTTSSIPIGIAAQGQAGIREEVSRTRVNIHNPLDRTVSFSYRAVQPRSGVSPGATFAPVNESLDLFAARSLDCGDFITLQQSQPAAGALPGNEGFLVIESRSRLQVAAVYTQRVVKEGLKDEVSAVGLRTGKKNVFRGGRIPAAEDVPVTPVPTGIGDNSPALGGEPAPIATVAPPVNVKVPIQQYGNGPVHAAAMGLGLGVGVGRGIGLGIGAGGGIDVEYVEPIVVPRRPVLRPVLQPPSDGG